MKALKIVGGILAVIVIGLVIFIATFDVGKYKGMIEEQAKLATGREVKIGGLHMAVSLTPTVIVEDITVANAPWGSKPTMLSVKRIEAHASLLPLLTGKVDISKIGVETADALLEVNKQGVGNWEFDTTKGGTQARPSQEQTTQLNVGAISVKDLKIDYKDAKLGAESAVSLKSLDAKIDGAIQDLKISHAALAELMVSHKAGPMAIDASIAKFEMDAKGKITDFGITEMNLTDIKVNGKTASGPLSAAIPKLSLDEKGAIDLAATYNGEEIKAKGTIASPAALKGGVKAVPAKLSLEGMGLKGDVDLTIDPSKTPPAVKGSITIPEIDLAKFVKPAPAGSAAGGKGAPASGPLFSTEPLPWDSLNGANAEVVLKIGTLKLTSGQTVENVTVPLSLAGGKLTIKDASVDLFGGKAEADVSANAADKSVAVKAVVKGLTAEALAKAFKKSDLIENGPLDMNVDIHGSGASPHGIASTLSGSVIAGMGQSKIKNSAMNFVGADVLMNVLNAINPMGNKDPYTVAKCGVVNFQISGGVATTQNGLALSTDKMDLTATGNANLGPETIDMVFKPNAKGGLGIGLGKLVSAVKVKGPIMSPNIGLDAGNTVKALGGLGAAFATGGLSMLAQGQVDKATAGDVCAVARSWHLKK
jgi:uncharacterized protein involved in outer membrane biogenesis